MNEQQAATFVSKKPQILLSMNPIALFEFSCSLAFKNCVSLVQYSSEILGDIPTLLTMMPHVIPQYSLWATVFQAMWTLKGENCKIQDVTYQGGCSVPVDQACFLTVNNDNTNNNNNDNNISIYNN